MDSKKTHKLSKATVATVLAASGVIVALPQPTNAYSFSDLNPNSDYFEPIMDLVNRKILSGYPDGTFKPNKAITREEAAKMLAQTLNVNISNPSNPRFKDVPMSNSNYRYIAALVEAGVINGFPDNTFKPKEPITRAQMAKIITLGFKLGVSTKLNHGFKDVSSDHPNAYFIQTMLDLNITKGTSIVTFEPFKTVTRGQMATFIWRAENADRGNPTYTVGDVTGDKIYINGVAHTIAPHLRSILNASNKNILKGAFIEGTYSGTTLTNISKLTINASGTSSRLLALDGSYTSFAGELIINGSYLRFKNINFTGRVEVATAPRRTLAALENVRVASIGTMASFIDWNKPTEPNNEDFLNPSDDETLQDKPDPNKPPHLQPYKERMANIKQYIDFDSSDIRNLYISGDRAFVKSNYDIDRLTVNGDVTNMELYADVNAMYVDTDYNVTFFGENDIKYVYKNTLKNVFFNTNSVYEYYYVTNSNGYTNIGDHVIIDNAIIPPGKTVNDIFDDYKTDDPNIGWIEDSDGKPVDRDPIDNTVIPDVTSPEILQLDVKAGGTVADVTLTANENGTYYYIVQKADLKPPSINEIKTGGKKHSGSGKVIMDEPVTFQVTDLESLTEYTIYAIVIDGADNVSNKKDKDFKTVDSKPPTLKLEPGDKMFGGKRVQFKITPSEAGTYYYYIRPDTSAAKPTVDDVIQNHTGNGKATDPGIITITEYKHGVKPALEEIRPNQKYQIFAVMVDDSGNKGRLVEEILITSEGPDEINPFVSDKALTYDNTNTDKNYFYLSVSEELDKKTAEDINNYVLSGTGIINVTGQKEIKPSEVVYIGGPTPKVRLTIPSITGFVKGDTLRVTVLPGVKDLAENPFENVDTIPNNAVPRNEAIYIHEDPLKPIINITKLTPGTDKYLVEVETNKAGTYHYMILPKDYDFTAKGITNRDFVDEFDPSLASQSGKFLDNFNNKEYVISAGSLSNQKGPAELGKSELPPIAKPANLNPFISYSIYMVLKDRSGQLSEIKSIPLVADTKPPLVEEYKVTSVNGFDDRVNVNLKVDEAGFLHVIPIRKYNKNPDGTVTFNKTYFNPDGTLKPLPSSVSDLNTFKTFGGSNYKGDISFEKGTPSPEVSGLVAHEEYGMYIAVSDAFGNFTLVDRADTTSTPIPSTEPNGEKMMATFYTDGTKPKIVTDKSRKGAPTTVSDEAIIYRDGEIDNADSTFTITFSEIIMRQEGKTDADVSIYNKSSIPATGTFDLSSILKIEDGAGSNVTSDYKFVSYTVGTTTNSESKLVIKAKDLTTANQTIKVTMLDTKNADDKYVAYDYAGRDGFDTNNIGKYAWPIDRINAMSLAKLSLPYVLDDPSETSSKLMNLSVEFGINLALGQRFYYGVTLSTNTTAPTVQAIMDAVNSNYVAPGSPIILYGSDTISSSSAQSKVLPLETGKINSSDVFKTGQKVYMFTIDNYGNIIWAIKKGTTQNYIEITK